MRSKMYKLLFIFFIFVSSPLYSNEFTYHCDRDDNNFSMVFDVNRTEKSVVHTHSIFKTKGEVRRGNVDLEIYRWDEENDSVWTLIHSPQTPSSQTQQGLHRSLTRGLIHSSVLKTSLISPQHPTLICRGVCFTCKDRQTKKQ